MLEGLDRHPIVPRAGDHAIAEPRRQRCGHVGRRRHPARVVARHRAAQARHRRRRRHEPGDGRLLHPRRRVAVAGAQRADAASNAPRGGRPCHRRRIRGDRQAHRLLRRRRGRRRPALVPERLADVVAGRPNRMAPNTALCFLLAGAAVLVLDVETRRGRRPAQFLALATGAIALQALLGYVYGALFLIAAASFIPMAFNTAAAFLLFSAGVLAARPVGDGWCGRRAGRYGAGSTSDSASRCACCSSPPWRPSGATSERPPRLRSGGPPPAGGSSCSTGNAHGEAIRGERGYLLTSDTLFLRPYIDARDSLPAALESATALFAALPVAAARFGTLGPMVQDAMTVFSLTINLDKSGNRRAPRRWSGGVWARRSWTASGTPSRCCWRMTKHGPVVWTRAPTWPTVSRSSPRRSRSRRDGLAGRSAPHHQSRHQQARAGRSRPARE